MDVTQFDALTKALSTPTSRRQALKALTATAAGATLGLSAIGPALATRQDQRPPIVGPHDARPEELMTMSAGAVTRKQVEAALPKLETLATETLQRTGIPGLAITVVHKDEVLFLRGFGVRKAGTAQPVTADTVFQLASVSKPIASTIVASVVGDKVVTWDDPIIKHVPSFQMDNPYVTRAVTLRDMFCHRSGLPDHAGDLLEDLGFDRATILHRLRFLPTGNRFRATYAYTNFGLTAAAVAAARAAGTSWDDLAAARLYRRLGMTRTSSRVADFAAAPNRALLHVRVGGRWVARYTRDPETESPAGGVSSSVRDLARWLRLQLATGTFEGQRVIDAAALAETHRPQIISAVPHRPATDRAGFYGLGWNADYGDQERVRLSHSGAFNLGAATNVTLLPSEQLGIVALTNARPIGVPEALTRSFLDLVLTGTLAQDWLALYGQRFLALDRPPYGTTVDYTRPPAHPSPALSSSAYVGAYHNDFFGTMTITAQGGGLVLTQGPHKAPFPLTHFARDVFTYQPVGENAYGLSAVTFTAGAEGKATRVVVENLDIRAQGTFTRDPL
jgi:CubicO group peptidase (beta-lactamase class C family)